jgi:hypothetical protein
LEPDEEPRRTARDDTGILTLLPKQLWSSFKVNGDDGEVVCEVGWVLGDGNAVTSTCVLSKDGDVKASSAYISALYCCLLLVLENIALFLLTVLAGLYAGNSHRLRVPGVGDHLSKAT